jgi:hypothetical protein
LSNLEIQLETWIGAEPQKITNIYSGRRVLLVDFDGVIHSYKSGWKGPLNIADHPVKGAFKWLADAVEMFDVRVFSARCNAPGGPEAMQEWFSKWQLPREVLAKLRFEPGKPSAFLILDDRALRFDGSFAGLDPGELSRFKPWYYGVPEWSRPKEP